MLLVTAASATYSPAQRETVLLAGNTTSIVHHHHASRHHRDHPRPARLRHQQPARTRRSRPAKPHHRRPRRVHRAGSLLPSRQDPWTIRIPSIGVDARLIVLGYPASSHLPVPSLSEAFHPGWYRFTSVPGRRGNAVVVGHVDTYRGPAVFYDLYQLRPGDRVYIRLGSHGKARYTVTTIRELSKSEFPANQIFGYTRTRRLWLITCGGPFNYHTHHYLDNIIVSAVGPPPPVSRSRAVRTKYW
jgi:LPXTG-site transpeptidase (sortase) family protein